MFSRLSIRLLCTAAGRGWVEPSGGHTTNIQVYNCVAEKKVPIVTRFENLATFYTCGPTVYDETHIGHASCYVKLDIIQRLLKDYFKINLLTAMNITDLDDKIIRKGEELKRDWKDIAKENEAHFWDSLRSLNVQLPHNKVRVTEHLQEIENFISRLLDTEYAYKAKDDSVYFDCKQFPYHGKLAKTPLKDEDYKSHIKRSSMDFALWKNVNNSPKFETKFGPGRPGWHIECSAMASKLFGDCVDFHGGGWDLKFPHHENEETQSCAFYQKQQWVNYWLHTGELKLKGDSQKMSKSLKNTVSVKELLASNSADEFRMFCLLSNYKSNTEFSPEGMLNAQKVLNKFTVFLDDIRLHLSGQRLLKIQDNSDLFGRLKETISNFDKSLRDDFDTARGLKVLIEFMTFVNRGSSAENTSPINSGIVAFIQEFYEKNLVIFGLNLVNNGETHSNDIQDSVIDSLVKVRTEMKKLGKSKKETAFFEIADLIRKELINLGVELKDRNQDTTTWTLRTKD